MPDKKPATEADVTKDWRATHGQESAAKRLRIFAVLSWIIAIGGEVAGIVLLYQNKFDDGNLPLLIGILVGIAVFAIAGSLLWKAANKHDPARKSDKAKFFFQNQLGAIITLIALAPGVLEELRKTEPKLPSGKRKGAIHQRLSQEHGHPKLREHLASVTTIMALSDDYKEFKTKLDRRHPPYNTNLAFDFMNDTGTGF